MWFGGTKRVRLREDLTRYHAHLKSGAEGTLVPNLKVSTWGSQDNFGAVRFNCCGATLDIALKSLDIEGAEEEAAARDAQLREDLKTTTEAVLTVGPRGGFRHLSIVYNRGHLSVGFRHKGEAMLEMLKEHGIKVEKRVEPR